MKKLLAASMGMLVLGGLLAGCRASVKSIDTVPVQATLVYNYVSGYVDGTVVTLPDFICDGKSGYFVLEIKLDDGELKGIQIKDQTNDSKTLATLGNVMGSVILATDTLVLNGPGNAYSLAFSQMKKFGGEINVYFVAS